jgi:TonB family protein
MWRRVAIEQYPLPPQNVPPTALGSYRIAGTTKIVPNAATQRGIAASGKNRIVSSVKYCIDEAGAISSTKFLKSSGFPDYDATILAGIEAWRFKPYVIDGDAAPVCTAVTFIYP